MAIKKKNCSFWVFGCILFEKFVGSHKNEWMVKKTWNPLHNYQIVYDNNKWYFFATIVNSDPWQEMKFEVLILSFLTH